VTSITAGAGKQKTVTDREDEPKVAHRSPADGSANITRLPTPATKVRLMPETLQAAQPTPLTTLTEDEILFRDNIRQFADEAIRPHVREMDEKGVFEPSLIEQFFQLGLMGIEVPEQYGGGAGTFFEAVLAVEEVSRGGASAGWIVVVKDTLVNIR